MKNSKHIMGELKWFSFIIPALVLYVWFFWVPSFQSIYYSLTNWDGVHSEFIGIQNYIKLFQDKQILNSIGNTIFYTVMITVIQNVAGLLLAVLLKKSSRKNNFCRTLLFTPYILSFLLIGFVFKFILEANIGAFNNILRSLNLDFLIRPWISDPSVSKWVIVLVTVWQATGYTMVINIAGLQSISECYYEAAKLDGASKLQQFFKITIPLIAPSTTINIMLCLIGNLQIFDQIYALTGGGPAHLTESIAVTMYRLGFGAAGSRWGYGAAMAVVTFGIILIITLVTTTMLRKREVEI